jgi:hypothetical protein
MKRWERKKYFDSTSSETRRRRKEKREINSIYIFKSTSIIWVEAINIYSWLKIISKAKGETKEREKERDECDGRNPVVLEIKLILVAKVLSS